MSDRLWRKSSYSDPNGQCVELADLGDSIGLRDSKLGDDSPVLHLHRDQVAALVESVKAGDLT